MQDLIHKNIPFGTRAIRDLEFYEHLEKKNALKIFHNFRLRSFYSWQELSESTLNARWSKLLPEYVATTDVGSSCARERCYQQAITNVITLTWEADAPGFEDLNESDILEVVQPGTDSLSAEETEGILLLDIAEKTSEQAIEIN